MATPSPARYYPRMTVARLAISLDPALARSVRKAAGNEPTSAWLAEAARQRLRSEGLLAVVADWEQSHGEITESELRAVEKKQQAARRKR